MKKVIISLLCGNLLFAVSDAGQFFWKRSRTVAVTGPDWANPLCELGVHSATSNVKGFASGRVTANSSLPSVELHYSLGFYIDWKQTDSDEQPPYLDEVNRFPIKATVRIYAQITGSGTGFVKRGEVTLADLVTQTPQWVDCGTVVENDSLELRFSGDYGTHMAITPLKIKATGTVTSKVKAEVVSIEADGGQLVELIESTIESK